MPNSSPRNPSDHPGPKTALKCTNLCETRASDRKTIPKNIVVLGFFHLLGKIIVSPHLNLVSQQIPSHQSHLDPDESDGDGKQIPTPNVVNIEPIRKQQDRQDSADDPRQTRGPQPVIQKSLINRNA
jgi:hypothetical protein